MLTLFLWLGLGISLSACREAKPKILSAIFLLVPKSCNCYNCRENHCQCQHNLNLLSLVVLSYFLLPKIFLPLIPIRIGLSCYPKLFFSFDAAKVRQFFYSGNMFSCFFLKKRDFLDEYQQLCANTECFLAYFRVFRTDLAMPC